jgi:hypothetical protein
MQLKSNIKESRFGWCGQYCDNVWIVLYVDDDEKSSKHNHLCEKGNKVLPFLLFLLENRRFCYKYREARGNHRCLKDASKMRNDI